MKLGIFTDSHYCQRDENRNSLKKIDNALKCFENEKCDFVVFLGDLIDKEADHSAEIKNLKEISDTLNIYNMKISVIIGNHDTFSFDKNEFYHILGEKYRPQNICIDGKKFIFIDSCHSKDGASYVPGFCNWSDIYFPYTDILERELLAWDGNSAYIFTHHNLDPAVPENHRISNAAAIRNILEKINKVHTVFQGHHHKYIESYLNGIHYITYPSLLENKNSYYTEEL